VSDDHRRVDSEAELRCQEFVNWLADVGGCWAVGQSLAPRSARAALRGRSGLVPGSRAPGHAAAAVRGRSTGGSAQRVQATAVRRTYQRGRPAPLPGIGVNGGLSRRSRLAARRPYAGHGIAGPTDLDFRLPRRPRIRVMRG
jgi:hypothetical protein